MLFNDSMIHSAIKHPVGWLLGIILVACMVVATVITVAVTPFILLYGIIMWVYETTRDAVHLGASKIADNAVPDDMFVFSEDETFDTYLEKENNQNIYVATQK